MIGRLAVLEGSALFFNENAATLRTLARRARPAVLGAGTLIVAQGEIGDSLFLIQAGHCVIRLESSPGHSIVVAVLGPGDVFGEDSFVSGEGSRVSATAADEVHLLAIDRSSLFAIVAPGAALRQALIFRMFLDRIEPDERIYHAGDPAHWLTEAARRFASAAAAT